MRARLGERFRLGSLAPAHQRPATGPVSTPGPHPDPGRRNSTTSSTNPPLIRVGDLWPPTGGREGSHGIYLPVRCAGSRFCRQVGGWAQVSIGRVVFTFVFFFFFPPQEKHTLDDFILRWTGRGGMTQMVRTPYFRA